MKRFRSVLFWGHLAAGVLCGVVILVMSFTGTVLALKPQIQNWVDRDVRYVALTEAPRLGAQELLTAVKQARPDASPQSLALDRDPEVAAMVSLGREGNVYVNPYTGAILGKPSAPTAQFFQSMTSWHRYTGATGESRDTGRAATGASNLAFLLLGLSGLYLWWSKALTLRYVKPIVWFRRTSTGRAREFNWHNTIGFWCLPAIVVMTMSGVMMSYTWANNLVYTVTGSPIPARGGGPGGGPGGPAGAEGRGGRVAEQTMAGRGGLDLGGEARVAREGDGREGGVREGGNRETQAAQAPRREGGPAAGRPEGPGQAQPTVIPAALNMVVARAEQQIPAWTQMSMRLPNRDGGPVSFTLTGGAQWWNQMARSNLTLNSANGEVVQWQPYEGQTAGQKLRGWLRFAHTGEAGGLAGQIIAGVGCLGGVSLVYTGLSLAFRRLWNWSLWPRLGLARPRARVESSTSSVVGNAVME